jgi:hypothetical protein
MFVYLLFNKLISIIVKQLFVEHYCVKSKIFYVQIAWKAPLDTRGWRRR